MKLTTARLKKLIREELKKINEMYQVDDIEDGDYIDYKDEPVHSTPNPRVVADPCRFSKSQAKTAMREMEDIQYNMMTAKDRTMYDGEERLQDAQKKYDEAIKMAKMNGCDWLNEE